MGKVRARVLLVRTKRDKDWLFGVELVTGKKVLFREVEGIDLKKIKEDEVWLCEKRKDMVNYVIVEPVKRLEEAEEIIRNWPKRQEEYRKKAKKEE